MQLPYVLVMYGVRSVELPMLKLLLALTVLALTAPQINAKTVVSQISSQDREVRINEGGYCHG